MNKQKAFTLIELLVVVAIIGILAAVGVTTFNGFQEKAKKNTPIPHLKKTATRIAIIKVLNTSITDVYGGTDLQLGTFYKCSPSGSKNFEAQGQHSLAQGWNGSKGKYFAYVYTCHEDSGTPLITNIQLN